MKRSTLESLAVAAAGILLGALVVIGIVGIREKRNLLRTECVDWRKLNLVLQVIDKNYVDSVDRELVTDVAIDAVLAALDPHSVYMPPQTLEENETDLAGEFGGVGIQFNVPADTAVIIEVIPGGPSEKAGILAGDRILEVDGVNIAGVSFPQDSMVRKMRGPSGTKVKLLIGRSSERIPFDITRAQIPTFSVDASFMVSDSVGYIRLSKFSRTTYSEFTKAAFALQKEGMTHLVIDLRQNSGGYFDQALKVANLFLPKDADIVYIEGLHREKEEFKATGTGPFVSTGLSVLIDEGSASSSEILAGAIQDNGRGVIVGRRSFGKGLVQEPYNFTDGSGIRLTVSRFHTPSGRCLQKPYTDDYDYEVYERYSTGEMLDADSIRADAGGIVPDVFVPIDTTRAGSFYTAIYRKATTMRFASSYFDSHRRELLGVSSYPELLRLLDSADLEKEFLSFASKRDGLVPSAEEWRIDRIYMIAQVRALVGRYSKLGENAYYHLYLPTDQVFLKAQELIGQ